MRLTQVQEEDDWGDAGGGAEVDGVPLGHRPRGAQGRPGAGRRHQRGLCGAVVRRPEEQGGDSIAKKGLENSLEKGLENPVDYRVTKHLVDCFLTSSFGLVGRTPVSRANRSGQKTVGNGEKKISIF